MKKLWMGYWILILHIKADSQQFYFPQKTYDDTAVMNAAIPKLANQLIEFLNKSLQHDSKDYYEELFKCQIAAGKLGEAVNTYGALSQKIAARDSNLAKTFYFAYRSYVASKLREERTGQSLDIVIMNGLRRQSSTFSPDQWRDIETQLLIELDPIQKNLIDKKDELRKLQADSLQYSDARALCLAYTEYTVHAVMLPVALSFLAQIKSEDQSISFQDSILISARDGAVLSAKMAMKKNNSGPLPVIFQFSIYPGLP